jgi:hypothetical protein
MALLGIVICPMLPFLALESRRRHCRTHKSLRRYNRSVSIPEVAWEEYRGPTRSTKTDCQVLVPAFLVPDHLGCVSGGFSLSSSTLRLGSSDAFSPMRKQVSSLQVHRGNIYPIRWKQGCSPIPFTQSLQ